jgi:hypothetical protein
MAERYRPKTEVVTGRVSMKDPPRSNSLKMGEKLDTTEWNSIPAFLLRAGKNKSQPNKRLKGG